MWYSVDMDAEVQKLTALEEELRRDLEAITRVRQIMALKNGSLSKPDDRQIPLLMNLPAADPQADDDLDEERADSLIGTIDKTINSDPNIRWTTTKMLAHLQSIQYPLKAQKPIYSVGQTMKKLEEKGRIRVVRRGSGSAPNIYKGKATEPPAMEDNSQGGNSLVEPTRTE
jgi:hypothetical protein